MDAAPTAARPTRAEPNIWRNPIALWALALGVVAHFAGFFAFSINLPPDEAAEPLPPEIYFTGANEQLDQLMQEQSELLDFEPLFLPTTRNASVYLGWDQLVERTEPFTPLPARLLISEERFPDVANDIEAPVADPAEMLERDTAGSFGAFGQIADNQPILTERAGRVEVYREGNSQIALQKKLTKGVVDEAVNNLSGVLEWRLMVGPAGVVGQPLMERSSGLEGVDAAAAEYLIEEIPQWGLAPGYYRVVIGP